MVSLLGQFVDIINQFGIVGLFIISFLDSFILPAPPELVFIPLGLANPHLALWYALIIVLASVLGGAVGYLIGLFGGRPLVYRMFKTEKVARLERLMLRHGSLAIFIISFSPIPYKLITITAGVLQTPLSKLILWSVIGRSARFVLEGLIIYYMGRAAQEFLTGPQFVYFTIAVGLLVLLVYLIYSVKKKTF
ncbi:YqaA family protein [Desulfofalx alkaliphila]|uniref:YqaA family protein n=1 Tax=Desulfofalx alkaliphila TaxID=105483 RepID=UPI00068DDB7D|nr:VTT domain-containing protein [Desulfofalx alkaliphila]